MAQALTETDKSMKGCVMLALSTFRRSEKAIDVAIEKCQETKKLMVVYVIDINVARYLVGVEEEFFIGLKEKSESEMLEKAEKDARDHVATIVEKAKKEGIQVKRLTQIGRFAAVAADFYVRIYPSRSSETNILFSLLTSAIYNITKACKTETRR
jgi:nucleotide-binding universal stress UspA family protein